MPENSPTRRTVRLRALLLDLPGGDVQVVGLHYASSVVGADPVVLHRRLVHGDQELLLLADPRR